VIRCTDYYYNHYPSVACANIASLKSTFIPYTGHEFFTDLLSEGINAA